MFRLWIQGEISFLLLLLNLCKGGPGQWKAFLIVPAVLLNDNNPKGKQTTKEESHCSSTDDEKKTLILKFTRQCQRHTAVPPCLGCTTCKSASNWPYLELCLEKSETTAEPLESHHRSVVPQLQCPPWADKMGRLLPCLAEGLVRCMWGWLLVGTTSTHVLNSGGMGVFLAVLQCFLHNGF